MPLKTKDVESCQKNSSVSRQRPFSYGRSEAVAVTRFEVGAVWHSPYSQDLTLSNFHLFPSLKQHLGGCNFVSSN